MSTNIGSRIIAARAALAIPLFLQRLLSRVDKRKGEYRTASYMLMVNTVWKVMHVRIADSAIIVNTKKELKRTGYG